MLKLRTLKMAAVLRNYTKLRPVLRCQTRWSGTYFMTSRFFQLLEHIRKLIDDGHDEEYALSGMHRSFHSLLICRNDAETERSSFIEDCL
jgi:hypothetical protein